MCLGEDSVCVNRALVFIEERRAGDKMRPLFKNLQFYR